MKYLAVIGCGERISWIVKNIIDSYSNVVEIKAVMDIDIETAKLTLENKFLLKNNEKIDTKQINFYENIDDLFDKENIDGVLIGTRCNLHTYYAMKIMEKGLPLFLEKPISTTFDDLEKLYKAYLKYPQMNDKVIVSFPLRVSPIVDIAKSIIQSGKIGAVAQVQAYNNVNYGRVYYKSWYRDENITQGLFLQKATHDFDYINYILGDQKPVKICAMKSKIFYKGEMPVGQKCSNCPKSMNCVENAQYIKDNLGEEPYGENCSFAIDTGNEDSGSAIVMYENNMHINYTQNFIVRKGAGNRGARIVGTEGTLDFDWESNQITVYQNYIPCEEIHKIESTKTAHGGGDHKLVSNFVNVLLGKETSRTTLCSGLESALLCLNAKKSAETFEFCDVNWDWIVK